MYNTEVGGNMTIKCRKAVERNHVLYWEDDGDDEDDDEDDKGVSSAKQTKSDRTQRKRV